MSSNQTSEYFTHNIDGCLESAIGADGLTMSALDQQLERLGPAIQSLKDTYDKGSAAFLQIVTETSDIEEAATHLAALSEGADTLVFFGTGGSSLGGQALAQLGGWNIPGGKQEGAPRRPRVRIYDNLDARTLGGAFQLFNLETTRFVVTSKSGGTAETMTQALVALKAVEEAGHREKIPHLFLGITEPAQAGKANPLRNLFTQYKIPLLDHHTKIGGRYSCFSNVGLLPAIAFGLDAHAIRAGAFELLEAAFNQTDPHAISPALGAALGFGLHQQNGANISILLPYADQLERFSKWYVQLWAESLGKNGAGTTPLAALGPVDQHSMLQLLMDGPQNFLINIVRTAPAGTGPIIDESLARSVRLDYLAGRHVGDLTAAQQVATVEALIKAGRPVRTFDLPALHEKSLGALMMHFMLETVLAAHLYEVDPFDQPAVEIGKKIAQKALSTG